MNLSKSKAQRRKSPLSRRSDLIGSIVFVPFCFLFCLLLVLNWSSLMADVSVGFCIHFQTGWSFNRKRSEKWFIHQRALENRKDSLLMQSWSTSKQRYKLKRIINETNQKWTQLQKIPIISDFFYTNVVYLHSMAKRCFQRVNAPKRCVFRIITNSHQRH